jgi:hypothetical protein
VDSLVLDIEPDMEKSWIDSALAYRYLLLTALPFVSCEGMRPECAANVVASKFYVDPMLTDGSWLLRLI